MHISSIFQWGHIQAWHETWPTITQSPNRDVPSKNKKELQAFLVIVNYLCKFPPSTADVCESIRQLTSSKAEKTWNDTYQKLFDKTKSIIKEDLCMKFYDKTQPLYLETDVSGVGLGTALLHTRNGIRCPIDKEPDNSILRPIAFMSKSLSSIERRYSNIKREALGTLFRLMKFPLLLLCQRGEYNHRSQTTSSNLKKWLNNIITENTMNSTQNTPNTVKIIKKPRPYLFIVNYLSRQNHKENKDAEIPGMQLIINIIETTANISDYITIHELQQAMLQDEHLQCPKEHII